MLLKETHISLRDKGQVLLSFVQGHVIDKNRWRNCGTNWTCATKSRDSLEDFGKTGKVGLQERALDWRDFTPFAAKTSHNEQCKHRSIAVRIESDSFQTNCGQRSTSNTDRLFHYSRWNHIFYDSRRYVERYFELIILNIVKSHIEIVSLG